MAFDVIIETKAQKEFLKLSPPWDKKVKATINKLEKDPRLSGVKKLSGSKDGYRIRVSNYRILYTIDDREKIVTVYRIKHRREVYK